MENQLQSHHQIMDRRHDALGDLRVLPDEIICGILEEYFSPVDLARLSCVSSVLYVLCNEEPLWMRLCLKQGGQLQYKGSWKKTTLYRQNLCNAIELSREKPLQFYGFNSLFLYRRWYRCYTTLSNFNFDTGHLEKRKNLSLEEFCSQYDGRKPILLTELAENWPARVKWTKDQLALSHGDVAFRISQRSSKKVLMTFKDYVSYMEHQHDEDPLYIFDDKFGEVAPSLLEDYKVPHLFQEDFFDVLDHDQRPPFRWLIIGPERSGASWHVDPALTSAWNTLLFGRKRWALYPPGRVPAGVTVHVNEDDGDVNIDGPTSLQWWLDVYPHLAECDKPIECTQLPGETIYVPSGWWHCVLNLEITIAVTQNYVNQSNFGYTCLDMTPGHRHKGVCRAGLLAVNDETLISMSSKNYPDLSRKEKRLKVLSGENKPCRSDKNWKVWNSMENVEFSYDVDFISNFLEPERDHYTSVWCPSNCIGPREMRQWLHKLWIMKPEMRPLIWKGACLALNVDRWLTCAKQICTFHNLPFPNLDEQFPVGTGSNPVFLFSDYVIKICTEGGLESSLHSLGTELEFNDLLHQVNTPLLNHIPEIVCSGLLVNENGSCKPVSWDGRELPNVIAYSEFVGGGYSSEDFQFGIWRKMKFEVQNTDSNQHSTIWPYVVTKRCKGDIFANLRDGLKENEILHLASFLGEQLHNIHLLPLPPLVDVSDKLAENVPSISNGLHISKEWEPVIAILNRRRKDLKDRLSQWGDPIPEFLIEKVEEYIPHDLASLFDLSKSGEDEHSGLPTWIHSDVMDDNIHLESNTNSPDNNFNVTVNLCNGGETRKYWLPTHILDFSNLTIGDPLYDIIPIYLDIFRGDGYLLKKLIESYKLPLERTQNHVPRENMKKFARTSYRAMCFCILHEDNILGAIFSLWKDLKQADSWEKVEETVWGPLNNFEGSGQRF